MGASSLEFLVPARMSLERLHAKLVEQLSLHEDRRGTIERTWYDTFDWRLFRQGDLLVREVSNGVAVLHWRRQGGDGLRPKASLALEQPGRFVWDLPPSRLRDGLAPVVEMRAMLPVATVRSKVRLLAQRDRHAKVVVRLTLEQLQLLGAGRPKPLDGRVSILPLKGYDKARERAARVLEEDVGLVPAPDDLLARVLDRLGREPGTYSSKINVRLEPTMRADAATKVILRQLLQVMAANLEGMREDLDSEFLHDFRVAVRRTRSALGRIRGVFPSRPLERFRREFRWLGQVTGPTRDMDVYLLGFEDYRQRLPRPLRKHLDPLHALLIEQQATEHQLLVAATRSRRFDKLMAAWRAFLHADVPRHSTLANAERSALEVAGKEIWRAYRRALRDGAAITPRSAPELLHELRKTCKKLRYLLEFFKSLFPAEAMAHLTAELKLLQENLGDFQDLVVQVHTLEGFRSKLRQEQRAGAETLVAIGVLVERLHERRLRAREQFAATFARFASAENRKLARKLFGPKTRQAREAS